VKTAYLHESNINSSESRLRLTIGPKKTSVQLCPAALYWRDDASSRTAALSTPRWWCELHGYILEELAWSTKDR